MGTTLDNGIYLPDEGERNCYEGLAGNWVALDNHLGSTNIHVTINDKQAWNGHVADTTIHVTSADKQAWDGHVADPTIHVTSADKQAWDGHVADSVKHVTAEDKAKWDAVTSKANDSDVVHKSGNETISGNKTFSENLTIGNTDSSQTTKNLIIRSSKINLGDNNNDSWGIVFNANNSFASRLTALKDTAGTQNLQLDVRTKDSSNNLIYSMIRLRLFASGASRFEADTDNTVSLGSSSVKFKDVNTYLVNGLEPSSLSLPSDRSARIDISSYFTNTGTGQSNSYTVPANGYIYLTLSELTNVHCFSCSSGNVTNYAQTFTKLSNSTGALYVLFPVRKNDVFVATWYTTTTVSVDGAYFIPCQGNI